MKTQHYDVVVIGTGAGGGTMARALADTGARILVLERGGFVPAEDRNWDPVAVWKELRYRAKEHWIDEDGQEFLPYMHYGIGGNTKYWGTVLYRFRRQGFEAVDEEIRTLEFAETLGVGSTKTAKARIVPVD